jgi:hypothetical protein
MGFSLTNFQMKRIERFVINHLKKVEREQKRMQREHRNKIQLEQKDERARLRQERRDFLKTPEGVLSMKKYWQDKQQQYYAADREAKIQAVRNSIIKKRIAENIEVKAVGRPRATF